MYIQHYSFCGLGLTRSPKRGLAARQQRSRGQPVRARMLAGVPHMPLVELAQILHAKLVCKGVAAAREVLVEQRRCGMASLGKRPRRVGQVLRGEFAHPPCRLLPNRVEERRGGMAGCGKRPGRDGQCLRDELVHPPCRLHPNRVKERRGGMAGRGKRPRRVGQCLRDELVHPPCRLHPNRVKERRGGMTGRGKRPRRVGQGL